MNSQPNNIITPREYKELIALSNPDPIQIMKIKNYEDFLNNCAYLEQKGLLPEAADSIVSENNMNTMELANKENRTLQEEKVVENFQNALDRDEEDYDNIINFEKAKTRIRTIAKAGYIDVTFVLISLLNLGFIIAMSLISR